MIKRRKHLCLTDNQIRLALKQRLLKHYKGNPNICILDEFGIMHGSIRTDLVVIDKLLHGYEFKSDVDTLRRLPIQAKHYSAVFDRMTLVVGYQHVNDAIKMIPYWWGVIIAERNDEGFVHLYDFRTPRDNPKVETMAQLRLLWKKEALSLLGKSVPILKFRSKSRDVVYNAIVRLLDPKKIRAEVVGILINRPNRKSVDRQTQDDG